MLADLYWPVVVVLSVLLLTSVYHLAVPVRGRWRYELPGALFVFAAWMVGSQVLRLVLSASIGGTSIYGPLAAPIVVLLWLYFIVISVLIGAALNSSIDSGVQLASRELRWQAHRPSLDHERAARDHESGAQEHGATRGSGVGLEQL